MPRAKQRCPQVGCREYKPCRRHQVWKKSSGQRDLPSNWGSLKKKARGYADRRCYVCNRIKPNGAVDHIINRASGGSDHPSNLAWICEGPGSCHERKTAAEKSAGQRRRQNVDPS